MNNNPLLSQDEFNRFQAFFVEESGLFFDNEKNPYLSQVLWERLRIRGYHSYEDYYHFLSADPEGGTELRALLDILTTNETYFFRSRAQFDALMDVVLPEIIEKKRYAKEKSLRVWSAGCSRGNEAYSIAIAMMEKIPDYKSWNISILGTDINRNVLIHAKEAVYGHRDLGHSYPEYIEKYFTKKGSDFHLNDEVKRIPQFEYHNLAKDPFSFEGMQDLDIIFCRNVTIYFDFTVMKDVINQFYGCLNAGGFLFLGHAETLWQINDKFEALEFPQTFIYKKRPSSVSSQETMKPVVFVPKIRVEDVTVFDETESVSAFSEDLNEKKEKEVLKILLKEAIELSGRGKLETALHDIDAIISRDKDYVMAYFARANILANLGRYEEAIDTLEKMVILDNLFMEAYYLQGTLLTKIKNWKEAERRFRKVIYIDPEIVMAYFNIGSIYLSQKNFDKAALEFTNAINLLKKEDKDKHIRFCEEFTVEFLLRTCRNNITEMLLRGWQGNRLYQPLKTSKPQNLKTSKPQNL